jgi:ligand-binding sensor domain-containing protein
MFRKFISFNCLLLLFCSCASDTTSEDAENSGATVADSSFTEQTSSIKPFAPDANWITPAEVVSQYGPSGIVRDVVIDRDGIIWLAAWDGIVSYDPSTTLGTGSKQFTNHTLKEGLSHHRVYSVMEDSKGNMWFGTMGAGAYKYDGNTFTNLSSNNGMVSNTVFDIFEDQGGNIWFATDSGVSRYSELSGAKTFTNISENDSLHGHVYAISQDTYGTIWIGTSFGLYNYSIVDAAHGAQTMALNEVLTESGTHYSNVRDLCWSNGIMWIGAARGLYESRPLGHVPLKITRIDEKFTSYICADNTGNILLTSDGIFRYDVLGESGNERFTTVVADKSNLGIFGAEEDKDGTIWYGAMDGLHSVREGKDVSYRKP